MASSSLEALTVDGIQGKGVRSVSPAELIPTLMLAKSLDSKTLLLFK